MTNFNMGEDEPSSNLFFNPYMQSDENLKEKDKFCNREECIRAIKKFHMLNSVDFNMDRVNPERYKIKCVHPDYMFNCL